MSQLSDPPCPQCCGAVPEETPPPNSGLYERGYICCVHETLATVAEHIFKESPGIKEDPGFRKQFVDALSRIYNDSHRRGKIRPCIMMAAVSPDEHRRAGPHMRTEGPIICIMGTFHGSTPRDRVYLHFLVPMFPNCGEMRGGGVPAHRRPRDHLHTRPKPWKHYKQWAIAFLYRSPNPILEAWRTGEPRTAGIDGKTTPEYWLDRESFSWFRAQCEERLDSWSALCKADPNFARSCALEYRRNRASASRRSSLASCSSRRSVSTMRQGTPNTRPGTPLGPVPEAGSRFIPPSPHPGRFSTAPQPPV